jgi:hypothetical protein
MVICIGADFFPSFYGFTSLIIIPSLPSTHVSPLCEMCDNADQAAHDHILSLLSLGALCLTQHLAGYRLWKLFINNLLWLI